MVFQIYNILNNLGNSKFQLILIIKHKDKFHEKYESPEINFLQNIASNY